MTLEVLPECVRVMYRSALKIEDQYFLNVTRWKMLYQIFRKVRSWKTEGKRMQDQIPKLIFLLRIQTQQLQL